MTHSDGADQQLIERQRAHFSSVADRYRLGRLQENHIALKTLIWDDALAGIAPELEPSIRVLEPMCGFAEGADILASRVESHIDYEGFDYSDEVVREAIRRKPGAKIWSEDVTKMKPRNGFYDVIILIGGLHHAPHHAGDIVRRLSRGLKPGGFFINFEPTSGNWLFEKTRDFIYRRNDMFDEETEKAFPVQELLDFFKSAGLKRWRVFYPGLSAYVLYYNPYAFPWLNIGGARAVKFFYGADGLFKNNFIGRVFSFATLSVWRKP